uniref:Co-chaperonin GroES n=1 Tax=uncultured virus TaxID=340016 RepID=A0A221S4G4_9VIRU|nr:co-chaperonin GroES [uncultured virus]
MSLEALYNAVIVKPIELEETMYGNIVVPDVSNETNKSGEVVAVGEGQNMNGIGFVPTQCKVGDKVVLPTMGFTRFEYENQEYWIGPENQLLARIKE